MLILTAKEQVVICVELHSSLFGQKSEQIITSFRLKKKYLFPPTRANPIISLEFKFLFMVL
jgi:hypothetical protein